MYVCGGAVDAGLDWRSDLAAAVFFVLPSLYFSQIVSLI